MAKAVRIELALVAERAAQIGPFGGLPEACARGLSAPKDCMIRTAPRFSAAKALASASVSWAARERPRTERPAANSGSTTIGIATSTRADSLALV